MKWSGGFNKTNKMLGKQYSTCNSLKNHKCINKHDFIFKLSF